MKGSVTSMRKALLNSFLLLALPACAVGTAAHYWRFLQIKCIFCCLGLYLSPLLPELPIIVSVSIPAGATTLRHKGWGWPGAKMADFPVDPHLSGGLRLRASRPSMLSAQNPEVFRSPECRNPRPWMPTLSKLVVALGLI